MTTPPTPAKPDEAPYLALAEAVGLAHDADVLLFSGGIEHEGADELIRLAKRSERRPNVVLLLTTRGGSADAAFRMVRCLQTHYTKLTLYIHGMCKSAGTLVAIGVDEIILSDFGEFGPLDVQLGKKDELFESTSGLDITQALSSLNVRAYLYFRDVLMGIRQGTRGQISTKLAAEIASKLAVGVFSHIYGQIDPVQLGSVERALRIASEYGEKIARKNLLKDAIARLATGYPSHSFVIDLEEAKGLFRHVRGPTPQEEELGECISFATRDETDESYVELLNPKPKPQAAKPPSPESHHDGQEPELPRADSAGNGAQGGENHGAPSGTALPQTSRNAPKRTEPVK